MRVWSQLLDEWFLLAFFRCCLCRTGCSIVRLGLVFGEDVAQWLMFLPLAQLTVTRAVPGHLALRASLGRHGTTLLALRILQEVLENFIGVEIDQSVHVLLFLRWVLLEESLCLLVSDLSPVLAGEEFGSNLGQSLYDEGICTRHCAWVLADVELFEAS